MVAVQRFILGLLSAESFGGTVTTLVLIAYAIADIAVYNRYPVAPP